MHKKITAIIIDDERPARTTLRRMLALYCPEVAIKAEADNIVEGVKLINSLSVELVFLDMRIGQFSGFDLLDMLPSVEFQLVFVTAYDEYAIQAFRYNALDYLLKPIDPERLREVIDRSLESNGRSQVAERLELSRQQLEGAQPDTLVVSNDQGYHFLKLDTLYRISSSNGVTTFYQNDHAPILVARNIGEFEQLLPKSAFFRCHQSHIINFNWVSSYLFRDGGSIMMRDGNAVPLARARKDAFLARVKIFL
jgi:two-component system, LytTR family, response regulator